MIKFFHDTNIIFKHRMLETIRNPVWVVFGIFQPIAYLVLFMPFLGPLTKLSQFPARSAVQFFVPNILVMLALFGAAFAGFALIEKLRHGVLERLRVTPVSRTALVVGLVLRDVVILLIQSCILILGSLFFGFHAGVVGLVLLFALLLLMGITMASISYSIALAVKDEGTLATTTNFFTLPLLLLAGVFLPLEFAPSWIQWLAVFNPFAYAADAAQALAAGNIIAQPVIVAFAIFIVLSFAALWIVIYSMKEAVA